MVREKTPSFPAERCKEMLGHYQEVIAELQSAELEHAPISADLAQRQAAGDAPSFGPKDARLTFVEYSDFECPFCGRAAEVINKVKEKYGTKVRFVFRQFPLQMHRNADLAAQASLAAHAQGKFWPFHDLLFQNQRDLERASLEKYAQKVGLDMAKFRKALDERTYEGAVKADMKLAAEAHVSGTPSVFVGTERVANAIDFEEFSREIDRRLAALD
jgi:protein-disulfide isomerase